MNNRSPVAERNFESSEETTTSSSSTKELPSHVVNLKESKTHLFYVIQSDSNDSNGKAAPHFVRIKISKERPPSKKFVSKKMFFHCGNSGDVTDGSQGKTKMTNHKPNLTSIHKRTDHPSFVVLPEVFSRRRGNVERNLSTSDNSNETYVIRSKLENKMLGSRRKVPTLFGALWKRNSQTEDAYSLQGQEKFVAKPQTEDYCECDKGVKRASSSNRDSNANRTEAVPASSDYLKKDDLFSINFVKPTEKSMPQRLRAGQDSDRRYQSCYICPDMKRIFPPTSHAAVYSNNSDSDSTLNNRSGYVKINYKLVRRCLINGSTSEKCQVLDAIRLRMKSSDSNLAIRTIEEIVKFDLFGVQCDCRSTPLLEELLWPIESTHQLQTSAARFVNALASYKLGRTYFNNRSIIRMLTFGDIGRDNIDSIMGDNLIGIMMKLSFNRFHRSDMIKNELFRWLLKRMEEEEYSATKYHLQCMAGLMRNLLRGYNLENLSSIEIQRLIVLLGRYLDIDNSAAKRYICDSLRTLFQNIKSVATAKELNFQKVIQDHLTMATNPIQREHLRAIHQLLNRSATSKSFSNQKLESLSEEEPFLDADLEPDLSEEIDHYPGESLLREKFSGDIEAKKQEKKSSEPHPNDVNDKQKDGKLITRVFVEHLNCFLPNIEKNRIFPLYNARCADKIATCSHLGDIQPKKRQPYIPPNSRKPVLPRQGQSIDEFADELRDGYNKSTALKSKQYGKRASSSEKLVPRISTISHDRSAAKWHHYEKDGSRDSDDLRRIRAPSKDSIKKIFVGQDVTSVTGQERLETESNGSNSEEVMRSVSYHHDSTEAADKLDKRPLNEQHAKKSIISDRRLDLENDQQSTGGVESLNRETSRASRGRTRNRKMLTKSEEENQRVEGKWDSLNKKSEDAQSALVEVRKKSAERGKGKDSPSSTQLSSLQKIKKQKEIVAQGSASIRSTASDTSIHPTNSATSIQQTVSAKGDNTLGSNSVTPLQREASQKDENIHEPTSQIGIEQLRKGDRLEEGTPAIFSQPTVSPKEKNERIVRGSISGSSQEQVKEDIFQESTSATITQRTTSTERKGENFQRSPSDEYFPESTVPTSFPPASPEKRIKESQKRDELQGEEFTKSEMKEDASTVESFDEPKGFESETQKNAKRDESQPAERLPTDTVLRGLSGPITQQLMHDGRKQTKLSEDELHDGRKETKFSENEITLDTLDESNVTSVDLSSGQRDHLKGETNAMDDEGKRKTFHGNEFGRELPTKLEETPANMVRDETESRLVEITAMDDGRNRTTLGEKEVGRVLSTESTIHQEADTTAGKILVGKENDRHLEEAHTKKRTNQQPTLNVRSTNILTQFETEKSSQLRVRSEEMLKSFEKLNNLSIKAITLSELNSLNENQLDQRIQKAGMINRRHSDASITSESVRQSNVGLTVNTVNRLKVRSEKAVTDFKPHTTSDDTVNPEATFQTSLQRNEQQISAPQKLHARSKKMLQNSEQIPNTVPKPKVETIGKALQDSDTNKTIEGDRQQTPRLAPRSINETMPMNRKLIVRSTETLKQGGEKLTSEKKSSNAPSPADANVMTKTLNVRSREIVKEGGKNITSEDDKSKPKTPLPRVRSLEILKQSKNTTKRLKADTQFSSHDMLDSVRTTEYSSGNDKIGGTKQINRMAVRSSEFANSKQTTSQTDVVSSQSSLNKSNDCVDCRGSGYVLRARPSQPCDRCKPSLSKYPNFVELLNANQSRIVSRTNDEQIKVTWTNKPEEKLTSKPNQSKSDKEKRDGENIGGKSMESRKDADTGNPSSAKGGMRSMEKSGNETKEDLANDSVREQKLCNVGSKDMIELAVEGNGETEMKDETENTRKRFIHFAQSEDARSEELARSILNAETIEDNSNIEQSSIAINLQTDEKLESTDSINRVPLLDNKKADEGIQQLHSQDETISISSTMKTLPPNNEKVELATTENCEHKTAHKTEDALNRLLRQQSRCSNETNVVKTEKSTGIISSNSLRDIVHVERGLDNKVFERLMMTPLNNAPIGNEIVVGTSLLLLSTGAARMKSNAISIPNSMKCFQYSTAFLSGRGGIGRVKSNPNFSDELSHIIERVNSCPSFSASSEDTESVADYEGPNDSTHIVTTSDLSTVTETQLNESISHEVENVARIKFGNPINSPSEIRSNRSESESKSKVLNESSESNVSEHEISSADQLPSDVVPQENLSPLNKELLTTESFEIVEITPNCERSFEDENLRAEGINESFRKSTEIVEKGISNTKDLSQSKLENEKQILAAEVIEQLLSIVVDNEKAQGCLHEIVLSESSQTENQKEISAVDSQFGRIEIVQLKEIQTIEPPKDFKMDEIARYSSDHQLNSEILMSRYIPISISQPLEKIYSTGYSVQQATTARSIDNIRKSSVPSASASLKKPNEAERANRKQIVVSDVPREPMVLKTFDPVRMTEQKPKVTAVNNQNLFPARSYETVQDHMTGPLTENQNDGVVLRTLASIIHDETVSGRESELLDIFVRKSIVNETTVVLDEILIERRNLRVEKQTGNVNATYSKTQKSNSCDNDKGHGRNKVDSACRRRLLNDDELINRLSEKVLEKLISKNHSCGPNCKRPCGGLNSYLKDIENRNLE